MSLRIVIADDAAFIREIIQQVCEKKGWQIVGEADNGIEAVEVALREKPDIVIMDLIMPHKSGIDATKEILEAVPDMTIIACSTVDEPNLIMRALDAGCVNYITKPFEAKQLIDVMSSAHARAKRS